jgi:DNA-binding FrmR family transcriptional regulator
MSHTTRDKEKLLNRVRRIQGQLKAVEKAIEEERECSLVLQTIAAARGAINGLMAEILEGHVRFLIYAENQTPKSKAESTEEVVEFIRAYVK